MTESVKREGRNPGRARWLVLAALLVPSACRGPEANPPVVGEPLADAPLQAVNAAPTGVAGTWQVGPVLAGLERVEVVPRDVPGDARVLATDEWSYDAPSGSLRIAQSIDDRGELVVVHGRRAVPWAWRAAADWDPATVRLLHGDTELVRDRDFEVDTDARLVRLLRPELCSAEGRYYATWHSRPDPARPNVTTAVAFGNHDDPRAVRRFLGLPEEAPASSAITAATVGTNALATDDPAVFTLSRPILADDLQIAIGSRSDPAAVDWLAPGAFDYDPALGTIELLGERRPRAPEEYLFVSGMPARDNVLRLRAPLDPASVRVVVGDRRLVPGEGFRVDPDAGTVTILDPAFLEPGVRYYVSGGELAVGNFADAERLTELLRE